MDQIELLRAFDAVAEAGSFVGAADRLGTTNKQVSKQVAALEDRLGVRLFQRTTRSVTLTEVGSGMLMQSAQLLSQYDEMVLGVQNTKTKVSGKLKVAAPISYGEAKILPLLAEFADLYPELKLQVDLTDRFNDLVEEGYDAAIRIGELADSSLIARKIAETNMVLVASPEYLAQNGEPERANDLLRHKIIFDRNYRGGRRWIFGAGDDLSSVTIEPHIQVNSPTGARQLALKGIGIANSPYFIVENDIKSGSLKTVLSPVGSTQWGVYIVYPSNRYLAPKVRSFVDFVSKHKSI